MLTHVIFSILIQLITALIKDKDVSPFVSDTPNVDCQIQRLTFEVETKEPFAGRLFVKGHSNDRECAVNVGHASRDSIWNITRKAKISIDYQNCGMERIRSLSPKGVTYATTVTVQFHRMFITEGDKSFRIRCFYAEERKTVTSDFDVSMVPTRSIEHDMELPSCSYTIRSGTINGPVVRSSTVGDVVYHRWECTKNTKVYGMLVHSCIIENEGGRQTLMVDPFGCATELDIVPGLTYSDDSNLAYTSTKVFKYPDDSVVRFRCQIRICTKMDNGCSGLTPPACSTSRKIRSLLLAENETALDYGRENPLIVQEEKAEHDILEKSNANLDVIAADMLVLDESEQRDEEHQLIGAEPFQGRPVEQENFVRKDFVPDDDDQLSGPMAQPKPQHRQSSRTSFYDGLLAQSITPSPAPTSSSDQRRSNLRRGTDTTTLAVGSDNTFVSDVHSSYWELCVNRIILLSILCGFTLFFLGSVSFVAYVLMERSRLEIEEPSATKNTGGNTMFNVVTTPANRSPFSLSADKKTTPFDSVFIAGNKKY